MAVILCSPRSGSSLLKNALESHPDIASLGGEIEPFMILTKNGFNHNSDSDAISTIKNEADLIDNIFDDLTVASETQLDLNLLIKKWEKRLLLQFPSIFQKESCRENLVHIFHDALRQWVDSDFLEGDGLEKFILTKIFKNESWRINYYDGQSTSGPIKWFDEPLKVEEPPFILPNNKRRQFVENDVTSKILLFKTPPDVYRIGMYEKLFPNAEIKYIHLTRGYAQSVNGLMDGWLSPVGFFSHDLRHVGVNLNVKGYSDCVPFGRWWWKFDLPPNWREFLEEKLENVCLNQWISAHQSVLASGVGALRISFEDFLDEPDTTIQKIQQYLGLPAMKLENSLPLLMATDVPKSKRWHKRRDLILSLGKSEEVEVMMELLGYEMNPESWV
ncbi:sulfotransferase [Rhodoferax sp. OV413]|uniref:sulfotransferase n=1 Tax=Rhodoferax sp. OV413 TaxID=1855285 RepID=UPI002101AF36|nr:sulfotransferase [Rhodoferax sp. OV413]